MIGIWVITRLDIGNGETFANRSSDSRIRGGTSKIGGRWFNESADECVVGVALARREKLQVGDELGVEHRLAYRESPRNWNSLHRWLRKMMQSWLRSPSLKSLLTSRENFARLMVSALVKPDDAFGRSDPKKLSGADFDRWYCSAYIGSIGLQIEERIPGVEARPIRQVAEGEGKILGRISLLLWIVTLAALIAAGLAVGATAATSVLGGKRKLD